MFELANCSLYKLLKRKSPSTYIATVFLISSSKTNKTSNKEYIGALCHKDLVLCAVGALAMLFF